MIALAVIVAPSVSAAPAAAAKPKAVKPSAIKPKPVKPTPARKRPIRPTPRASARKAPNQAHPTPDRYREIQEALIQKGFLQGSASGTWDEESTIALKQFERSQKLSPDGKIDSLALISLGLGPRRESRSAPVTPPGAGSEQEPQ